LTKDKKTGGGGKPKREHEVLVRGAISVHTPVEEQSKHNSEREADATKHSTERDEDRGRETVKIWLEGLTLFAVLFYSGVTAWQGCMLRKNITNNTTQFQIEQRPYVWTTNNRPKTIIKAGLPMSVNIEIVNYGKSPAVKLAAIGKIFFGPTAEQDADRYFASLGDRPIQPVGEKEMVIPPGIPTPFTLTPVEKNQREPPFPTGEDAEKIENALPDGGFGAEHITLMSDNELSQSDVDYILNTELSIAIVSRIQYYDGFGNRHWSNICLSRFTLGSMPNCRRHNEMH
jgi:hypothetical protein